MHLLAPAKINLHLRVGRRRDDGFHPLLSWMCTVGLFDSLTLEARAALAAAPPAARRAGPPAAEDAPQRGGDAAGVELEICGDDDRPDLPRDGRNLVVRIATAFADELSRGRASGRGAAGRRPGPAFREEGATEPKSTATARAAAGAGAGSSASVGAAPKSAPGTEREGPLVRRDVHAVVDPSVGGEGVAESAGAGAGAVRGAEGSGRSDRHADRVGEGPAGDVRGPHAVPIDGTLDARRRAADARPQAAWLRVALDKRIPIGAGLGGGSSDAAHTLVALDQALAAQWPADRLSEFAAQFGSDLPFFVHAALGSPSAACRGRGDVVRAVRRPAAKWAVVFSPPFGLSTRDVYGRFDELRLGFDDALAPDAEPDWDTWARLPARELLKRLVNDLEPAAFSLSPDLAALRGRLEQELGRVVRMSGSGSSLFTLFDETEAPAAREAAGAGGRLGAASVLADVAPGGS